MCVLQLLAVLTQAEDIADNEGLNLAYLAYQRWRLDHKGEDYARMPALNITEVQAFFLGFSQVRHIHDV